MQASLPDCACAHVASGQEVPEGYDSSGRSIASRQAPPQAVHDAVCRPPYRASGSPSYFFYSVDVGPSHNIFLSNYMDYTEGSQQWLWLKGDLARIDRTLTPWVTVSFHNPW